MCRLVLIRWLSRASSWKVADRETVTPSPSLMSMGTVTVTPRPVPCRCSRFLRKRTCTADQFTLTSALRLPMNRVGCPSCWAKAICAEISVALGRSFTSSPASSMAAMYRPACSM